MNTTLGDSKFVDLLETVCTSNDVCMSKIDYKILTKYLQLMRNIKENFVRKREVR